MKKLFAIISAFMLSVAGYAQNGNVGEFTVQPMVGVTYTSAFTHSFGALGNMETSAGYGFTLGADLGYRVSNVFYPTVGAHYIQSRVNFDVNATDCDITTGGLAVPVLANFNISGMRLGVGIQPTFNLSKSTSELPEIEKSDAINKTTIAIPVVLGYETASGLTLEFRAAYDINKSVDFEDSKPQALDAVTKLQTNNLTGMFTIGYKFKM